MLARRTRTSIVRRVPVVLVELEIPINQAEIDRQRMHMARWAMGGSALALLAGRVAGIAGARVLDRLASEPFAAESVR
jgi:hypothetical protein